MALTLTFDGNKNEIVTNLHYTNSDLRDNVKEYMVEKAKDLQDYMKANRPWTDRTGAARANLSAEVIHSPKNFVQRIALMHGVWYGVYLEYAMERRFAILEPTMRIKGPEIISDLRGKIGIPVNVKKF